ncbi:substance-K receptor-like isoform X2 [Ornithodoros turicata]|uniref:substance-K receptor-like isoform X2 n=1 Tax=Ornithodoros turicata TaxID=34597 RepID=UPI003139FD5F
MGAGSLEHAALRSSALRIIFLVTCVTSSVLTLSAISCDRFIAIMFPLQAHVRVTKQRTSAVIATIWLFSVAISVPLIVYSRLYTVSWSPEESVSYCGWSWPSEVTIDVTGECSKTSQTRKLYYLLVTVTLFFLPVAIMLTAYSLIVWRLWITQMPGERNAANISAQCRAKKKVVKMVCTVLVAFVICWMPLQVIVLYSQFGNSKQRDNEMPSWFDEASSVATYIAYSNSLLNPIIYGGFNNNFRNGLCTVLHCYLRKRPSQQPRPSLHSVQMHKFHSGIQCSKLNSNGYRNSSGGAANKPRQHPILRSSTSCPGRQWSIRRLVYSSKVPEDASRSQLPDIHTGYPSSKCSICRDAANRSRDSTAVCIASNGEKPGCP